MKKLYKQLCALVVFAVLFGVAWIYLREYLTFAQLQLHKHMLMQYVQDHYARSVFLFILSYIMVAALALPGAVICSIAGGLLFGVGWGSLYVALSATLGAWCAFLATRYIVGNAVRARYQAAFAKFDAAFHAYGYWYLFIVRLVPIFPFFLVNLCMAFLPISSSTFLFTTLIGIIPDVIGFTYLGYQLRMADTVQDFFTYPVAIIGVMLLLPLIGHWWLSRRRKKLK
jgi:uncharacterized membrane protein YdjX (TVP38/TMEM64 family)